VLERFCKFGNECAYLHNSGWNTKEAYEKLVEDMKNIKAEVDLLKRTVKSQNYIREEAKAFQKSINTIKNEIHQIKAEIKETTNKIRMIEEDMESESEPEVDETEEDDTIPMDGFFSCEYCNDQFGISKYYKAHIESHKYEDIIKCLKCLFSCENTITFQKHMNTKHPLQRNDKNGHVVEEETDENEAEEEDDVNLYSVEMVNGEHVLVCNLCNEGLDNDEVLIKHMKEIHNREIQDKEFIPCENGNCTECIECIYKRWGE
jgi:hypothetical protein